MSSREEIRHWLLGTLKVSIFGVCIGFVVPFLVFSNLTPHELGIGPLVGLFMVWLLAIVERFLVPRLRSTPFLVEILTVTLVRIVVLAASGTFVLFCFLLVTGLVPAGQALPTAFNNAAPRAETLPVYVFMLGASFLATFTLSLSRKLGPGVLVGWILGRYRQPIEERRVVMFLDLNDSTTIAEEIGHAEFSSLVRDFMADLSEPILASRAQVSHYIGDEVVLTWPLSRRRPKAAWPLLVRLAQDRFDHRRDYYLGRYRAVPAFKCGVHVGAVITTEVGVLKSELVHHGDVMNVAARLSGLCKAKGCTVLATPEALETAESTEGFTTELIGPQEIKGRRDLVSAAKLLRAPSARSH